MSALHPMPTTGSIVSSAPSSVHTSRRPSSSSNRSRTRFCSGIGSVTTARSPSSTTRNNPRVASVPISRSPRQIGKRSLRWICTRFEMPMPGSHGVHRLLEAAVMSLLLAQRPDRVFRSRCRRCLGPAVVRARRQQVQLVAALRTMLCFPDAAVRRGVQSLRIAVSERVRSQLVACADRCGWSCRTRPADPARTRPRPRCPRSRARPASAAASSHRAAPGGRRSPRRGTDSCRASRPRRTAARRAGSRRSFASRPAPLARSMSASVVSSCDTRTTKHVPSVSRSDETRRCARRRRRSARSRRRRGSARSGLRARSRRSRSRGAARWRCR